MGGYDIEIDPEVIDITNNIAMGTNCIVDMEVELGYTYVYQITYNYSGSSYVFSNVANLASDRPADDIYLNILCMRNRNQVERGPISYIHKRNDDIEIEQDLVSLYNSISSFEADLESYAEESEVLYALYDIEERIRITLEIVDVYGYGLGRYGRDGIYGVTENDE